jgi:diacylglycerol kinase (ATP)
VTAVTVIVNPSARGGAAAVAAEAEARLRDQGIDVETVVSRRRGDGTELASAAVLSSRDIIIAAGGDGTAREVAEGMARAMQTWPYGGPAPDGGPLFATLPGGTGNSVYRALYGDRLPTKVIDAIASGRAQRMDVDLIAVGDGQVACLLGASAGFFRWIVDAAAELPAGAPDRYMTAALSVMESLVPFSGAVTVDGRLLAEGRLPLIAVGGAARRGGTVAVLPRSRLDDGLLDVCAVAAGDRDAFLPLMTRAMDGAHLEQPAVSYAQGKSVVLTAHDGPLPFEHDGEPWPGSDRILTLEIVPAALPVAVVTE